MKKEDFLKRVTVWDTRVEGALTYMIDGVPASIEQNGGPGDSVSVYTESVRITAPEDWFGDCERVS